MNMDFDPKIIESDYHETPTETTPLPPRPNLTGNTPIDHANEQLWLLTNSENHIKEEIERYLEKVSKETTRLAEVQQMLQQWKQAKYDLEDAMEERENL
jgi:hypothetical protein